MYRRSAATSPTSLRTEFGLHWQAELPGEGDVIGADVTLTAKEKQPDEGCMQQGEGGRRG